MSLHNFFGKTSNVAFMTTDPLTISLPLMSQVDPAFNELLSSLRLLCNTFKAPVSAVMSGVSLIGVELGQRDRMGFFSLLTRLPGMALLPSSVRSDTPLWEQMHQQEGFGCQEPVKGLAPLLQLGWTRACRRGKRETLLHQNWYNCAPFSVQSEMFYVEKMLRHFTDDDTKAWNYNNYNVFAQLLRREFKCCVYANKPPDDLLAPDQSGGPNIGWNDFKATHAI